MSRSNGGGAFAGLPVVPGARFYQRPKEGILEIKVGDWVEFEMNAPEELVGEIGEVIAGPLVDDGNVTVQLPNGRTVEADPDWLCPADI